MDIFGEAQEPVKLAKRLDILETRIKALERLLSGLCVDPGVDWVGRVVRERMLLDLHTRILRERVPEARAHTYL